MSVRINIGYEGALRCTAVHGPSGARLSTDAPKDNNGKGESFSPTDLVATALGTCLVTIMGIVAERHKLDLAGTRITVDKEMLQTPVRRIARLDVVVTVPKDKAGRLSQEHRTMLEKAAKACPVNASLHPEVAAPMTFVYES